MIGFILFTIAIVLIFLLTIVNYWYVENKKGYFLSTARNLDVFANREFRTLWNKTLIIESGYKFGNIKETISSVLGKNTQNNTLSKPGKVLVLLLTEKHCINAINLNT